MPEIQTSMRDYLKDHASLKYVFFGGKGGVGKTVFAAATAIWHARRAAGRCWPPPTRSTA